MKEHERYEVVAWRERRDGSKIDDPIGRPWPTIFGSGVPMAYDAARDYVRSVSERASWFTVQDSKHGRLTVFAARWQYAVRLRQTPPKDSTSGRVLQRRVPDEFHGPWRTLRALTPNEDADDLLRELRAFWRGRAEYRVVPGTPTKDPMPAPDGRTTFRVTLPR